MTKKTCMKKLVLFCAVLVLSISLACAKPATELGVSPAKVLLTVGASSSSSSVYLWGQLFSNVVNKYVKGVTVTHVETAGSYDNALRMEAGNLDVTANIGYGSGYEAYHGMPPAFQKPIKDIRVMFSYNEAATLTFVRADLPVKSISDLAAKKYTLGAGSSSTLEKKTKDPLDLLGIQANYYKGSWTDTATAMKERRIDGFVKSQVGRTGLDAGTMEVMSFLPLRVIGYTEEQKNKILSQRTVDSFCFVEAGRYKEFPDHPAFWTYSTLAGVVTMTRMPEETVYEIMKAVFGPGRDYLVKQSEMFASLNGDPKLSLDVFLQQNSQWIKTMPQNQDGMLLHAGAVRFYKELGLEIPKDVIPPEYKGK